MALHADRFAVTRAGRWQKELDAIWGQGDVLGEREAHWVAVDLDQGFGGLAGEVEADQARPPDLDVLALVVRAYGQVEGEGEGGDDAGCSQDSEVEDAVVGPGARGDGELTAVEGDVGHHREGALLVMALRGEGEGGEAVVAGGREGLRAALARRPQAYGMFLATAHPAKFPETVEKATGKPVELPTALAEPMAKADRSEPLPASYAAFRDALTAS